MKDLCRKFDELALSVDRGVNRITLDNWPPLAIDHVIKPDLMGLELAHPSGDEEFVIVTRGGSIAGVGLDHGEDEPLFLFYLTISKTGAAQKFRASDLKKAEVISIIDDATAVCISINDPI